jgi:nucleoside-diphosphate-sugar epimerase
MARTILVTGVSGQIGRPLARDLARHHRVIGVARFADPETREEVEALGIETIACDLAGGNLHELPDEVDHVIHLAAYQGADDDADEAMRQNAEATGLLLAHCRRATSALVMSTFSVYRAHRDPWHAFTETDPLGGVSPHSPAYAISKTAEEAVARTMSRVLDLPVTIARMNAAYGPGGGLLAIHTRAVAQGRPVVCRSDPQPYSPIHHDDIAAQVEAMLSAASTPATIVNWCGDEAVTVQQWCAYAGELLGTEAVIETRPVPAATLGAVGDTTRRRAITGPCRIDWRDGLAEVVAAL